MNELPHPSELSHLSDGDTRLLHAACHGDLPMIQHLIARYVVRPKMIWGRPLPFFSKLRTRKQGPHFEAFPFKAPFQGIVSALGFAAVRGHIACVSALLPYSKLDVCSTAYPYSTALGLAAMEGEVSVVLAIVHHAKATDQESLMGVDQALTLAAQSGHTDVVEALLGNVDVSARSKADAVSAACYTGHVECLRTLLRQAPYVATTLNHLGLTPLTMAALYGQLDCMRELLPRYSTEAIQASTTDPRTVEWFRTLGAGGENPRDVCALTGAVVLQHVQCVATLVPYWDFESRPHLWQSALTHALEHQASDIADLIAAHLPAIPLRALFVSQPSLAQRLPAAFGAYERACLALEASGSADSSVLGSAGRTPTSGTALRL